MEPKGGGVMSTTKEGPDNLPPGLLDALIRRGCLSESLSILWEALEKCKVQSRQSDWKMSLQKIDLFCEEALRRIEDLGR